MKTTVLLGAGQTGAMVSRLLGTKYAISCFADNNSQKWGTELLEIPVTSPEESLLFDPDCFCVCPDDPENTTVLTQQIRALGFDGPVFDPSSLGLFDSRVGVMRMLAEQIREENIPGDVAELGVFKGDFAVHLNFTFQDRKLHLFDTFEGLDSRDVEIEKRNGYSDTETGDFSETGVSVVWKRLPFPDQSEFYKGRFPSSFPKKKDLTFAFVSIDAKLYAPTAAALPLFYERLSKGGVLLVREANSLQYRGVGQALKEFCSAYGVYPVPVADLHGSAVIRKP